MTVRADWANISLPVYPRAEGSRPQSGTVEAQAFAFDAVGTHLKVLRLTWKKRCGVGVTSEDTWTEGPSGSWLFLILGAVRDKWGWEHLQVCWGAGKVGDLNKIISKLGGKWGEGREGRGRRGGREGNREGTSFTVSKVTFVTQLYLNYVLQVI